MSDDCSYHHLHSYQVSPGVLGPDKKLQKSKKKFGRIRIVLIFALPIKKGVNKKSSLGVKKVVKPLGFIRFIALSSALPFSR